MAGRGVRFTVNPELLGPLLLGPRLRLDLLEGGVLGLLAGGMGLAGGSALLVVEAGSPEGSRRLRFPFPFVRRDLSGRGAPSPGPVSGQLGSHRHRAI